MECSAKSDVVITLSLREMMQTFGRGRCNDKTRLGHPTRHRSHQRVNARRLPGAAGPEGHHAVSDPLSLKQLDDLQLPGWVTDQTRILDLGENRCPVQQGCSGFNNNQHRHHLQGPHDKLTQCSGHGKPPKVTDVRNNTVVGSFFVSYRLIYLHYLEQKMVRACAEHCQTFTLRKNSGRTHQLLCFLLQTWPLIILA